MWQQVLQAHYKPILAVLLVSGVIILTGSTTQAFSTINAKKPPATPAIKPSPPELKQIVIDIAGAVVHPGVYSFSNGSRIEQALKAAGGLAEQADVEYIQRNLNLSERLSDGMKLYIPSIKEPAEEIALVSVPESLTNVNSASVADLDKLTGITPAMAQKIVTKRPYQTIEQLVSKKVLTQATFDKIKKMITAN